ncbi:hypothetical protein AU188_19690 [Mycobacterium sp. IS-3022]|nr:hypothetical protein AU188_19690 [Mycobacterium sp. IS-3022]
MAARARAGPGLFGERSQNAGFRRSFGAVCVCCRKKSPEDVRLTLVGGEVFTRRIEHTFENRVSQTMQEVLM